MFKIKTIFFLVLMMALWMTYCSVENALRAHIRYQRGICKSTVAVCCLLNNDSDAKCCDGYPCCPWANCASFKGR